MTALSASTGVPCCVLQPPPLLSGGDAAPLPTLIAASADPTLPALANYDGRARTLLELLPSSDTAGLLSQDLRQAQQCAQRGRDHEVFGHPDDDSIRSVFAPIHVGACHAATLIVGPFRAATQSTNGRRRQPKDTATGAVQNGARTRLSPADVLPALASQLARCYSEHLTLQAGRSLLSSLLPGAHLGDATSYFRELLKRAKPLLRFDRAAVWIKEPHDPTSLRCLYAEWPGLRQSATTRLPDHEAASAVLVSGGALLYSDADAVAKVVPRGIRTPDPTLRSLIRLPLDGEGSPTGFIDLAAARDDHLSAHTLSLGKEIAAHASVFLSTHSDVFRAFIGLLAPSDRSSFLRLLVRVIPEMVGGVGCSVFIRDKAGIGPAHCVATTGLSGIDPGRERMATYEPGQGLTGTVLRDGRTLNLAAGQDELQRVGTGETRPVYRETFGGLTGEPRPDTQPPKLPFLAVPLHEGGAVKGVLRVCGSPALERFSNDDVRLLENTALLLTQRSVDPVKLLEILQIGAELPDADSLEQLEFSLLTVLTHDQGLGIHRGVLLALETPSLLAGRMAIGPSSPAEAAAAADALPRIPPLRTCLTAALPAIAALRGRALDQLVYSQHFLLEAPCAVWHAITAGPASPPALLRLSQVTHLSQSLRDLLHQIGSTDALALVLHPSPSQRPTAARPSLPYGDEPYAYVLLADMIYGASPITAETLALLEFFAPQVCKALTAFQRRRRFDTDLRREWQDDARMLTHDLRSSLSFISNLCQQLLQQRPTSPDATDWARILDASAVAHTRLDDLLRLQRVVTLNTVRSGNEVLECLRSHIESTLHGRAEFNADCLSGADLRVAVDEEQLKGCFDNLVQNILDLGLPRVSVVLTCLEISRRTLTTDYHWDAYGLERGQTYLALVLEDDGPGIEMALSEEVFRPYKSTKGPQRGLGLPSARRTLRAHGGHLVVDIVRDSILPSGLLQGTEGARLAAFLPLADAGRTR